MFISIADAEQFYDEVNNPELNIIKQLTTLNYTHDVKVKEFFILDPFGNLIRFAENIMREN